MRRWLILLGLLLVPMLAQATTYYVEPLCGNVSTYVPTTRACTGGSATSVTAFPTDIDALANVGDTIYVRGTPSGAFTGVYTMTSPIGGSAGTQWPSPANEAQRVTIAVYPGDSEPTVRASSSFSTTYEGLVIVKSRNYITLDGIAWDALSRTDRTLFWGDTTSPSTAATASSYGQVLNNTIYGARRWGLITTRSTNMLIQGNTIRNNGTDGQLEHGLYHNGSDSIIQNNTFYENAAAGIHLYNGSGAVSRNIVRYNTVYNNAQGTSGSIGAIVIWRGDDNQVYNNLCYASNNRPCYDAHHSIGNLFYNNTSNQTGTAVGMLFRSGVSKVVIRGNLVIEHSGTAISNSATSSLVGNNTTSGTDTDLWTDPNNATLASRNYTLKLGSAAIDAGTANICTAAEVAAGSCTILTVLTGFAAVAPDTGYAEFGTPIPALVASFGLNNVATDGGTQGNNGTANSITYTSTAGLFREGTHAAEFNATGDYITFPHVGLSSPTTMTVIASARATALSGTQYIFACNTESPTANRIYIYTQGTQLRVGLGSNSNIAIATVATGTYYRLALVINGTDWVLYKDGLVAGSGTLSGLSTLPTTCTIGNWGGATKAEGWAGYIDAVQVYNTAHAQADITTDCNSYCVTPPGDPGAPVYVALVLNTGGSTDTTGLIWTVPLVSTPVNPAVCDTMSDFVGAYNSGTQPMTVGCTISGSNVIVVMSVPPTSGAVTLTLAYAGASGVAVTNNFAAGGAATGVSQSGWACRDNPLSNSTFFKKPQSADCRVSSPGVVSLRLSITNESGATLTGFDTVLYCKKDAGSYLPVTSSYGSLDLKFDADGEGLAHGFTIPSARLSAAGGITAIHVGTLRRTEGQLSIPTVADDQQYEEEYVLRVNTGLALGTTFTCQVRRPDGSAMASYTGASSGATMTVKPPRAGF